MNASREMPKYECHKKVWARKIAGIVGDQHGGVYFQPAEEGYDTASVSFNPQINAALPTVFTRTGAGFQVVG